LSGHFTPDQWGDLVVSTCVKRRCSGVVIERTGLGDHAASTISAACKTHSMVMRILDAKKPFPAHTPGVVYVREIHAARSKGSRAGGPATETEAGRVHVVGRLDLLESELTTYEPGTSQSPNRFDAAVYAILELAELTGDTPAEPVGELKAGLSAHDHLRRMLSGRGARRI
jgi:phage terminase large subunit-like protein